MRTVAGANAMDESHRALERTWSMNEQIPEFIRLHTAIAVAEIMANTVEHGTSGQHVVLVEMHVSVRPDRIRVALIDDGNQTRADLNTIAMPGPLAERGRGLATAQRFLDGLVYQRICCSNLWLLTSRAF
jgi:serine/threonine-protein kinase RsbW